MTQDKTEKSLLEQQKELTEKLKAAARAYYQESKELMSNFEYDQLYDELASLETSTGVIMSGSPTAQVGYEVLSDLPKERHPEKMLSLDKTKEVSELQSFLGDQIGVLSWKLDGLTIVLTYEGGKLQKAVTRGNGEIGEVITNNAKVFSNIPLSLEFKGELVLRGEAVISYEDFEKINASIGDEAAKYKNPRNLCSGSVRQLNNKITAERNVKFFAFALVSAEGQEFQKRSQQLDWLEKQGFQVVQRKMVYSGAGSNTGVAMGTSNNGGQELPSLEDGVSWFAAAIDGFDIPSDGLVLTMDDIKYGKSLGRTSKFPRDSIAFKWRDEIKETVLREIEWSASRTGLINPVAIFDPVELEGTTVSRASVHNISVMRQLKLGIGDTISVYKANMIIPQIAENLTGSDNIVPPAECPVCGMATKINSENGIETLHCTNPDCQAKHLKSFTLFCSRDAMNIEGLSEMTLEKLIGKGLIKEPADIFHIEKYKEDIVTMEGFGEKSFENLRKSVDKARNTTADRFLYSLGVPNIGVANARLIAKYCQNKWSQMQNLKEEELTSIEGIGDVMARGFVEFFDDEAKQKIVGDLLDEVTIDESFEASGTAFSGVTFVITGALNHFENREELKAKIEAEGGKVAGSVSSKTSYLINNDTLSQSGKNKKAKELGIPVIDEETVIGWLENHQIEIG